MLILCDFQICAFRTDAPKRCLQGADFLIFELLAADVLKKRKNRILAGELLQKWKIAFPRRARIKKKMLPMHHGSAEIDFCNTSRTRTSILQLIEFFVVVNVGDSGGVKKCVKWGGQQVFCFLMNF